MVMDTEVMDVLTEQYTVIVTVDKWATELAVALDHIEEFATATGITEVATVVMVVMVVMVVVMVVSVIMTESLTRETKITNNNKLMDKSFSILNNHN